MTTETIKPNGGPADTNSGTGGDYVQRLVRPIVVTVSREEIAIAKSLENYHFKVADKIRDGGIPLGAMLWLASISEMSQEDIDRSWLKELSRHNLSRVDVEATPNGGLRILLWPNSVIKPTSKKGTE